MSFVRFYLQYSTVYSKSFVFLLSMERGLICLIVKRTRLKRGIGGVKSFNHRCRTLIFSRKVYIRAKFVWIVFLYYYLYILFHFLYDPKMLLNTVLAQPNLLNFNQPPPPSPQWSILTKQDFFKLCISIPLDISQYYTFAVEWWKILSLI